MRNFIRRSVYISVFVCLSVAIVSCEKDFTDIGSNVISNVKFDTNVDSVYVTAENSPLVRIQSDNIGLITQPQPTDLNQYLLGVYASPDYEKLEASIVSQLAISPGLQVVDDADITDTTDVVSVVDTVFLKLPYQVSLDADGTKFEIDSVIGDKTKPFNLNVYRTNTFISQLNLADPTKTNKFFSDADFEKLGDPLNDQLNFPFTPNENDTILVVNRKLFDGSIYKNDTVRYTASATSTIPVPFARIPLNKETFKNLFLDKYGEAEFSSPAAFNDYFRGVILEASGNEGSLISFNFINPNADLNPSIEVYYTNTVLNKGTTDTLKTVRKNNSFPLSGFRINTYKMEEKVYTDNNTIKIQGTAGSEGNITLFDQNKIDELKAKNWLINDATLTFYVNKNADSENLPERLYLYKSNQVGSSTVFTQIKDAYSEIASGGILGFLDADGESYSFKLTDYLSDILSGEITYDSTLKLKAFNPSDLPNSTSDESFRNYSWNPKAVTIFNNTLANGDKRPILKISYSEKK
ncbi:DUF4270 family protein [Polaribacter sp. Hel_I_88]|uniref:DUF4270 family protein n=1 Tax=Polaribacter sp. Hel_I_88 TaxID=1250006 RepID=UPI00047B85F0|nr:DUF4270 family protein [Polaribacter sp. Hel_I_88]